MIDRRSFLAVSAFATGAAITIHPALAVGKAFSKVEFEAAQKSGKSILVDVSAPWCPVCKAQAPILSDLMKMPEFEKIVAFNVDFDTGGQTLKDFRVTRQSTLIVFKGGEEKGRSIGDSSFAGIEALLKKAL